MLTFVDIGECTLANLGALVPWTLAMYVRDVHLAARLLFSTEAKSILNRMKTSLKCRRYSHPTMALFNRKRKEDDEPQKEKVKWSKRPASTCRSCIADAQIRRSSNNG
jgi:hypothetical protein